MSNIEFGCGFNMEPEEANALIESTIDTSPDLITAMESIGAMYGIPSSNIMCDDIRNVRVMNGNIVVPDGKSARGNHDTIIRSISTALDQISQRINEKIGNIQNSNIEKGEHDDTLASRIDPSKGTVILTTTDDDGEPVIVYDSGIIVAAHTDAGRRKAKQLRDEGNVPSYNPLPKEKPSYFSDDEDITKDVRDINDEQPALEYSMSEMINESQFFIDVIGSRNDTHTLGYDTFTTQGYDCVRKTGEVIQEAAQVNPEDIKHMKFDNSNIFKAIELFNKARAEQDQADDPTKLNMDKFVSSKYYKEAINCIEKQFDCHLAVKWVHAAKEASMAGTQIYPTEYRDKITVSKSKGFQLHGMPIHVLVVEDGISSLIPKEPELFGQGVVSIFLHEIFHNIAGCIRYQMGEMVTCMNLAVTSAVDTRDAKARRQIVDRYIDMLNVTSGVKMNRFMRRKMANSMLAAISAQSDEKLAAQYRSALDNATEKKTDNVDPEIAEMENRAKADKVVSNITKRMKKATKNYVPTKGQKAFMIVMLVIYGIFDLMWIGFSAIGSYPLWLAIFGCMFLGGMTGEIIGYLAFANKYKKLMKQYKNSRDMEEYYCDLMSATYQLPQRFFIGGITKYTANDVSQDVLNEFVEVEKAAYESIVMTNYPTTSERTHAGTKVAQQLLKCEHLDPNVRKYVEWIDKNNSNILNTNIDSNYNSHTYDPKEAEDVDKHVQNLIRNNNIELTEAAFEYLVGDSIFTESKNTKSKKYITDYMTFFGVTRPFKYEDKHRGFGDPDKILVKEFKRESEKIFNSSLIPKIKDYLSKLDYGDGKKPTEDELNHPEKMIKPKYLYINPGKSKNDSFLLMLDCDFKYEPEHGIAFILKEGMTSLKLIEIGTADLFL
jgi:hypothetical protein